MGGCRCSFRTCKSSTKTRSDLHFFHYPIRQKSRCLEWINVARKPHFIELPEDQLKNKVICQLHFEPQMFTNQLKNRLIHDAVPTLLGDNNEEDEQDENTASSTGEVAVLPANADGTVFVLNTDDMLETTSDIRTFSLQDDDLVPIEEKAEEPQPLGNFAVTETLAEIPLRRSERIHENASKHKVLPFIKNSQNFGIGDSPYKIKHEFIERREIANDQNIEYYYIATDEEKGNKNETSILIENNQFPNIITNKSKKIDVTGLNKLSVNIKKNTNSKKEEKKINSNQELINCLRRQVLKNSEEIEKLKKSIFKQAGVNLNVLEGQGSSSNLDVQVNENSEDMETQGDLILENQVNLSGLENQVQIPPSLSALFNIHLDKKTSNFSEAEKLILTTMYSHSPSFYRVLKDKLEVNLPSEEVIVELIREAESGDD